MTGTARLGFLWSLAFAFSCSGRGGGDALGPLPPPIPGGEAVALSGRWVASRNYEITVYEGTKPIRTLTSGYLDFKPNWSPDTDEIVFFRAAQATGPFLQWRNKICVIHADGTGFRELTSGQYGDFNPNWARDGSHRIFFNRYGEHQDPLSWRTYWTTPDASPGDEAALGIHPPGWEFVDTGLTDGRFLVEWYNGSGLQRSMLLTPGTGGGYQEVRRPTDLYWHKLSVSPSQTKVAYMENLSGDLNTYAGDVLYWAELDLQTNEVANEVLITRPTYGACTNEYPRWYPDETMVVFDSDCVDGTSRAYAYRLADGAVFPISDDPGVNINFVDYEHTPE
jgi:hypothetical protein